MGGVVSAVVKPIKKITSGGGGGGVVGTAPTAAPKKTAAVGKKIQARRKSSGARGSRVGRSLIGGVLAGGGTQAATLGAVRNPRDSKTNLGT